MSLVIHHEHSWDLTPQEAFQLQERLRNYVKIEPLSGERLGYVGGVDASFSKNRVYGAAVVIDYHTGELVEQATAELPLTYPYVPGLLSFREAPALLAAMGELSQMPDLLMVDGHGLAHPRGFGLACHLGVLLDLPAIGCAKSPLVGEFSSLAEPVGSTADLVEQGRVLGMAVRTRVGVKPVFVSVGHRVDLNSAVRHVLACTRGYKLPEPTRQADMLASLTRVKD
jgi:deoxyribonuclease V